MKPLDISKFRTSITKSMKNISSGFNDPTTWLSTGNYALNYLTSHDFNKGIPLGKSTVVAGESGCVFSTTLVRVILTNKQESIIKNITVGELRELFQSGEYEIEIGTPDGFHHITAWFDKGVMEAVEVETESLSTKVSTNHLFQVKEGTDGQVTVEDNGLFWKQAGDLVVGDMVLTEYGFTAITSANRIESDECYDFTVNHPNHRYYSDGFVSHNSGKSFIVSGNLAREAQRKGVFVILIDTENALDEEWLHALGVETTEDKLLRISASMIDDVAKIMYEFMENYKSEYSHLDKEQRPKVLFIIDSLGMLMTPTDVAQFQAGDLKGDMGRKPKALKAMITNVTNMFGDNDVGLVMTNHTYASQDMFSPDPKIAGGCLVAGHKLFLSDGTLKEIQDMEVGDIVQTRDGTAPVTALWHYEKPTHKLFLSDGSTIECSPEHKFLVHEVKTKKGHWIEAAEIEPGFMLTMKQGNTLTVITNEFSEEVKDVYDIEVDEAHHYILENGLVSHNSGPIYAASIVIALQKRNLKEDAEGNRVSEVLGIRSAVKVVKSRYSKPFETMEIQIPYQTGMNPYSGLVELFEKHEFLTKQGNRLRWEREDGTELVQFRKAWIRNENNELDEMMKEFPAFMQKKYPAVVYDDVGFGDEHGTDDLDEVDE